MVYRVLADMVVMLHLLWILFLVFGALLGKRSWLARVVHIAGLAFALVLQAGGWYCPLTYLEFWLRQMHEPGISYPGSFIAYYAERIVYIEVSPGVVLGLSALLAAVNAAIYIIAVKGRNRAKE